MIVTRYSVVVAVGLCKECADELLKRNNQYAWLEKQQVPDTFDVTCTYCHKIPEKKL